MRDLVVLGSLNMDLAVRTESLPRPGETVLGNGFAMVPGGKGANQAASVARHGARVEMIGCVGDDAFGEALRANLQQQGVGVARVRTVPRTATGVAVIIVDAQGENSIVVAPGANAEVTVDDALSARELVSAAGALVVQCEVPAAAVRAAIEMAASAGVAVILNAAPAHGIDRALLAGVPYVIVNEHEAEYLTGVAVTGVASAARAARALQALGAGVAIVTLGADGALFVVGNEATHVPAREVPVVDTTAAGDAFVGGFAVALLRGLPLREAVRYATCAGTLATTVFGAQPSLPSAAEVDAFYHGGPS